MRIVRSARLDVIERMGWQKNDAVSGKPLKSLQHVIHVGRV
jgi:hypothetical protein